MEPDSLSRLVLDLLENHARMAQLRWVLRGPLGQVIFDAGRAPAPVVVVTIRDWAVLTRLVLEHDILHAMMLGYVAGELDIALGGPASTCPKAESDLEAIITLLQLVRTRHNDLDDPRKNLPIPQAVRVRMYIGMLLARLLMPRTYIPPQMEGLCGGSFESRRAHRVALYATRYVLLAILAAIQWTLARLFFTHVAHRVVWSPYEVGRRIQHYATGKPLESRDTIGPLAMDAIARAHAHECEAGERARFKTFMEALASLAADKPASPDRHQFALFSGGGLRRRKSQSP